MNAEFLARAERLFTNAALDPSQWTTAMDEIVDHTSSVGASLLTVSGRGPFILATESLADLAQEYVANEWFKRDFRYAAVPKLKTHGIFTDQDIIPDWRLPKIPYYADFLEKYGTGWGLGLRIDTGCDMWCLMLQRGTKQGAYQAQEQAAVLPLAAIASRAATLSRQLNFRRLEEGLAITEQLGDAAFYIDRFGRVAMMNGRAEAMVASGRVTLRDKRITFPDVSNDRLMRHVDAAIWPDLRADDEALRPVAIRQPGRHPLVFRAIRIRGDAVPFFAPAYALLVATDMGETRIATLQSLRTLLNLTTAEAMLAQALMRTVNLVRAAEDLGISHETARSQLKGIFAKTETDSQLALMRLLHALPR